MVSIRNASLVIQMTFGEIDSIVVDNVDTLHKAIKTSFHVISDNANYSSI